MITIPSLPGILTCMYVSIISVLITDFESQLVIRMLDIIVNKYYIVFILQTICENGWNSDITFNNAIIAASTAVLVEWNHYITEGTSRSKTGQSAGMDTVYYEIFYGPLGSTDDNPVSTATSVSLICISILIDINNRE